MGQCQASSVEAPEPGERKTILQSGTGAHAAGKRLQQSITIQEAADAEEDPDSLRWLDIVLQQFWPHASAALEREILERGAKEVRAALPAWLQGQVSIQRASLGTKAPRFSKLRRRTQPSGMTIQVQIDYEGDVDISISFGLIAVGVEKLGLSADITIELGPMLDELPVLSEVSIFFVDPPAIKYGFSGIGKAVEVPGIKHAIRSAVDHHVASRAVMPNVISHALPTKAEKTAGVSRRFPPQPLGLLRVIPQKATSLLSSDWHTSDAYLQMKFADKQATSTCVKGTLNPVWPEGEAHDFTVYHPRQKLCVEVFDHDNFSSDDYLGTIMPCRVKDLKDRSEVDAEIFETALLLGNDAAYQLHGGRGQLRLRFEWLGFSPLAPSELGSVNDFKCEACMVVMEIQKVFLPAHAAKSVQLRMTIDGESRCSRYETTPSGNVDAAIQAVDAAVVEMVRKGAKLKVSQKVLAEMTGLPQEVIAKILADGGREAGWTTTSYRQVSDQSQKVTKVAIDFHARLCLALRPEVLPTAKVEFEALNSEKKGLGKATLRLKDMGLEWPRPGEEQEKKPLLEMIGADGHQLFAEVRLLVRGLDLGDLSELPADSGM